MARRFLFFLLVLSLLVSACTVTVATPAVETEPPAVATDPPAPTATLEPTEPPTPEPTATELVLPTMPPAPTDEPVVDEPTEEPVDDPWADAPDFFFEDFDDNADLWSYWLVGDENGDKERYLDLYTENSRLIIEENADYTYAYVTYDPYIYEDVGVEAVLENRGANTNNVSLICRYDEADGWYEFNIGSDGLYNILRYDMRTEEYVHIASGGSTRIKTGKAVNTYTAICEGEVLTLGINGYEVNSVHDRSIREGQIGVSVSSFDVLPVIVEFDSIEVFVP